VLASHVRFSAPFSNSPLRGQTPQQTKGETNMFVYSVKFVCGTQNPPPPNGPKCSPVRQGLYATEINIHNFNRDKEAVITKTALVLVHNDAPEGREPKFVKPQPFDKIVLPPQTATMDDCCRLGEKLTFTPGRLNIGFLEIASSVELDITAVYTATDLQSTSIAIDVERVTGRQLPTAN
jgi:hypothetical protein